jgi:2-polyprenyl-3-methyl-5-hydroxy-6-metoxy-1,4-benzoquinol methylase
VEAVERLTLEEAQEPTLLASAHVHRYQLAAELCRDLRVLDLACGSGYGSSILRDSCPEVTGVDRDEATIAEAQEKLGRPRLSFEVADAHEVLRRELRDSFDAIVMLESLEHLEDPEEALASLRRHADDGLKLVVSVPNSRTLEEDNPHHVTDFGYDEAKAAFADFSDARFLYQFQAEGSLIRGADPSERDGRFALLDEGEPEYASHFIALVNFGEAADEASARMQTAASPASLRYMRALEQANASLRQVNARLWRGRLGVADSAAASLLGRLKSTEEALAEAQRTIADYERDRDQEIRKARHEQELKTWIDDLHRQIDSLHRQVAETHATRVWRMASRYWAARDRLRAVMRRRSA